MTFSLSSPQQPSTNRSLLQPNSSSSSSTTNHAAPSSRRLSAQEAALRGASLAFQKQQKQQQDNNVIQRRPSLTPSQLSRHLTGSTAGSISRHNTGSSSILGDPAERERERQALFLSSDLGGLGGGAGSGGNFGKSTDSTKSASFIAATLAASRSASPGTATGSASGPGTGSGDHGGNTRTLKSSPLRPPVDVSSSSRRSSVVSKSRSARSSMDNLATDATSLPPTTTLISLFENKGEPASEPVKRKPGRPVGKKPKRPSTPEAKSPVEFFDLNTRRIQPRNPQSPESPFSRGRSAIGDNIALEDNDKPKPKPKPGKKPKAIITERAVTPPTVISAKTEILSPRPRKPERPPRLEVTTPSSFQDEFGSIPTKVKPKPPVLKPDADKVIRSMSSRSLDQPVAQKSPKVPAEKPVLPVDARPMAPRKSSDISGRLSRTSKTVGTRRQSLFAASSDGQDESRVMAPEDEEDIRPSTAGSKSSNDSFVSASSIPTRDGTDSIRTIEPPTSTASTPRLQSMKSISAQPSTMSLSLRRTPTGSSSQLPIDSLSHAIMAGSLASARHTPVSLASSTRTPPLLPPSRRKGAIAKHRTGSRRSSPHRMRQTMRQPASKSDDEDARRPHHHKKGLNNKKHAHHEGSRSRWREEITEREKKRYEAVWASNRGLFLTELLQYQFDGSNHTRRLPPVRNESYEAASEHVANVIVRDIWSRSRLPEPELAEVWDLVYGHGPQGPLVHAALSKQEFVVGMWLVDQRLRGRKIPPRVTQSVWDSAKGLRVLPPGNGHHHGHHHGHHKG